MTHRTITASLALVIALATATVACGTSGDDAADTSAPDTSAAVETTEAETTTSDPTTTIDEATTTTDAGDETGDETTTTAGSSSGLPSCQDLLVEYAEVFTPDDLQPVIDRFRAWAPDMPAEVGAAVERLADAYEEADGVLGNLDFADVDLTADAQTFSDWTNEGCPPG